METNQKGVVDRLAFLEAGVHHLELEVYMYHVIRLCVEVLWLLCVYMIPAQPGELPR